MRVKSIFKYIYFVYTLAKDMFELGVFIVPLATHTQQLMRYKGRITFLLLLASGVSAVEACKHK